MYARRSYRRNGNAYWGAIVLDTFQHLLAARLNGNELRVFLYLCYHMNLQDNICYDGQKKISEELQIHKTSVSRAIATLLEKQFIAKPALKQFMVNPHLFYVSKRNAADRIALRDIFDELICRQERTPIFELNEEVNRLEVHL